MGQPCSHMNIWAISSIVQTKPQDILAIMEKFEQNEKSNRVMDGEIEETHFVRIMNELEIYPSDQETFVDILRILDVRNRSVAKIRELLVSITPLVSASISEMFNLAFKLYDRTERLLIDKTDVIMTVKLINQTIFYVGDKVLATELVYDFVNSVYTSAGKIDGDIYYPDYIEYMALHPVVQLFISIQFQGSITSKLLTEGQIEAAVRKEQEMS